jgi:hypothetical protein
VIWCGNNTNEVDDGPLQEPQYYSYTDPNMGESSPTFDAHTPLPDMNSQGLTCIVSIFFVCLLNLHLFTKPSSDNLLVLGGDDSSNDKVQSEKAVDKHY